MRAELPWNVAGIPPEAREAARAAARREGLSVGEWLTRRILRSFSDMGDDPVPYERGAPLDSWGLPQSSASRRDTEDMLARVGRSESESSDAYRRIEDQLRGVARRLDSSERSHSENNRVLSRTTQEMNIAAREQAQAFDQLGLNVMALNERLERLERAAATDGMKEAVKGLHQGLSRLADQITQTANNSATQVSQLAGSLDQLASRVAQARVDSEDADRALEQRLAAAEKNAQFHTSALDHALEKIEASAAQRATDQVEFQRRAGQNEESLHRLEDSLARLEIRGADPALERRLEELERSLGAMHDRLEHYDPAAPLEETLRGVSKRLDSLEKDHKALVEELRANLAPQFEPKPEFDAKPDTKPAFAPAPPFPAEPAFEAPPFAESSFAEPVAEPDFAPPPADAFTEPFGDAETPSIAPPPEGEPFAATGDFPAAFSADADNAEGENFLTQARRSARAASERAEAERRGRFSGFSWRPAAAEGEERVRPRWIIPLAVALVAALAILAGLVLSHRIAPPASPPPPTRASSDGGPAGPTFSIPEPPGDNDTGTAFVVAPSSTPQQSAPEQTAPQQSAPRQNASQQNAPPRTAPPLAERDVRAAPVKNVPDAPARGPMTVARATQLANAGSALAQTILGLRDLDGTNGAAVNLPEAIKWLNQAAAKGQAVAQYRLGTAYERGQGVPADGAKAAHWYKLAAAQGNRKAMHNLAVAYASGTAGKKNMAEAARWFARAAALGLTDSQFNLAVLYERGDGVPQSLLDAYKWYTIAARAGDSESKARVGVLRSQLSDSDRAAAEKSAASFHAAPLVRSANVPPELADLNG
jgi:localization factor PodJL